MAKLCDEDFERVLARARESDEAAWAALYDCLAPQVLGYLRLKGAADAEEVLGDVFLHVARGIHDFDGDASGFRSWVFVIATSRLYDERRRLRRKPTDPLDASIEERLTSAISVEDDAEAAIVLDEVHALLEILTPDQRAVVELRIFADLTSQEVAAIVGKPVGAVKALYRRGLGALRREIEAPAASAAPSRAARAGGDVIAFPRPAVPLRLPVAVTRGS